MMIVLLGVSSSFVRCSSVVGALLMLMLLFSSSVVCYLLGMSVNTLLVIVFVLRLWVSRIVIGERLMLRLRLLVVCSVARCWLGLQLMFSMGVFMSSSSVVFAVLVGVS